MNPKGTRRAAADSGPAAGPRRPLGGVQNSERGPARVVLAVDDEKSLLEVYRLVLERMPGVRVITTCESAEALRLLRSEPVDLVVSDICRPLILWARWSWSSSRSIVTTR